MLTTVGVRCGIAAYCSHLLNSLSQLSCVKVDVFPIHEGRQAVEEYQQIAGEINRGGFDLVHIQHEYSFWGGCLPGTSRFLYQRNLLQLPTVLTAHTTYSAGEMLKVKTDQRVLHKIAKHALLLNRPWVKSVEITPFENSTTIVHTNAAKQILIGRGISPETVKVVPAGVPKIASSKDDGKEFRLKHKLEGKRIVSIPGYISPNKGYELVIQSLKKLPEDVILLIAGGSRTEDMSAYQQELRNYIATSGLQDRVVITDYLTEIEMADAMEISEVVLAPHTQATNSYSVTIPLSCGKPVLTSDQDCFVEIANSWGCVALFATGNSEDLTVKLLNLLARGDERQKLVNRAKTYSDQMSWQNVACLTNDIYQQIKSQSSR